jgi:2-methylcitrate dehydratase PrpD
MSSAMQQSRDRSVGGRLIAQALAAGEFGADVVVKAKLCLLDYLSCALASLELPWALQASELALPTASGAALIGRTGCAGPADAAFANAVAGHGLVREDMHTGSIAHLGVVVWPAVMAVAGREKASGRELLDAAIVGYEVGARIGRAVMDAELARLFRPTGLVGALAASVAVGRLYGLSADAALSALSLAANTSGGLNQWPHTGGSEMYFHPGFAARNGVVSADLARLGAIASATIFEGEAGFFRAFARREFSDRIILFPGGEAEILAVFNKPVPACNFAQTPCQAAKIANDKRAGRRVEKIRITASEAALRYPGCDASGPFDYALQAKMSIRFGVAATIARGVIAEENYALLADPEIGRLIASTTLEADPDYTKAFPERQGATVTLSLEDGAEVSASLPDVVPADADLIRTRFRDASRPILGAGGAEQIEALIDTLEEAPDAGLLDRLCARPGDSSDSLATRQRISTTLARAFVSSAHASGEVAQ